MRPSCGYPAPPPIRDRRVRDRRPARASGMVPPGRTSAPLPRSHDASWRLRCVCVVRVSLCVCVCAVQCARARRHEPPRPTGLGATSGSDRARPLKGWPRPAAAEPGGFRVAHCQGADPKVVQTRRSSDPQISRSSNLVRSHVLTSEEISQPASGLVTASLALASSTTGLLAWRRVVLLGTSAPGVPRPRWSRGDSNPGPPPCKGGALPAKLRPPTAASRRSAFPLQASHRPNRVGAPGLEPGTSALSGPRSNHLSYAPATPRTRPVVPSGGQDPGLPRRTSRPMPKTERAESRLRPTAFTSQPAPGAADLPAIRGAPARSCHRLATGRPRGSVPTDAGSPLGGLTRVRSDLPRSHRPRGPLLLPRKEVIQPQLPLRLPCYDFVPITSPALDGCLPRETRRVGPPASGVAGFRDVTGGVYKAREHIHRGSADPRLLATPASRGRVAAHDPN